MNASNVGPDPTVPEAGTWDSVRRHAPYKSVRQNHQQHESHTPFMRTWIDRYWLLGKQSLEVPCIVQDGEVSAASSKATMAADDAKPGLIILASKLQKVWCRRQDDAITLLQHTWMFLKTYCSGALNCMVMADGVCIHMQHVAAYTQLISHASSGHYRCFILPSRCQAQTLFN